MTGPAPHKRTQRYYDDFSRHYDAPRGAGYHALIDDLTWRALAPFVAGREVLEAGCGSGLVLSRIRESARRAVGLDLSRGMLSGARRRGLTVVQGSLTALPFADASFDTVCSFKVLAHIPNIDRALSELSRVTRPGGHLVLDFYNRHSLRYLARGLAGPRRIGRSHREDDIPTRWDSPAELAARFGPDLELVGWRGVRVVTPAAQAWAIPGVGPALAALEHAALESPLARFGGFLVAVLRRRR